MLDQGEQESVKNISPKVFAIRETPHFREWVYLQLNTKTVLTPIHSVHSAARAPRTRRLL